MSDPFNGLISSGLIPAMSSATAAAGGVRASREATRDSRNAMAQQTYADTLGVYDRMDARAEQGRQFDTLMRTRSDELAASREESAFAKLNSNLEFNLKMADQESKDRQLAFENTLKLQQHNFQQQIQTLQLRELNGRVAAQEFMAEAAGKQMAFSEYSDGGAYADDMENLYKSNPEATRVLMGTEEGRKFVNEYNNGVRAARMTSLEGVTKVDPSLVGETLTWESVNKNAASGELGSGRLSADQRQARALLYDRARASFTPEQIAEAAKAHEGASRSELELEMIKAYAEDQTGQPHWEKIKSELSSPDGEMRFKELYDTGMLEPIKNKQQILELKLVEESQHKVLAQRMAETNGRFLIDENYADELEELKEGVESARARIMSGGNPRAANALKGVVSVDTLHDSVMAQAERNHAYKRTWKDVAELTGLPGAYRGAKALLLGGQVESKWDYVDLALAPITFIPAVGLGVRATRVAGGAILRGGARALAGMGVKSMAKRGAVTASQGAVSQVFSGLAARKTAKATLVKAMSTKQAQKAAYESAKLQLQAARAGMVPGGAAQEVLTRLARAGQSGYGAQAAFNTARAAEIGTARAAAGTAVTGLRSAASKARLAEPALRATRFGAAVDVAGIAGHVGNAARFAAIPPVDYRGLERAKGDLNQAVEFLNAGNYSKESLNNVVQNLAAYRSAVAEYFPGGEIPVEVNETILNIRNIVPRSVASKIQRMVRQEFGLGARTAAPLPYAPSALNVATFGGMAAPGTAGSPFENLE